MFCCTGILMTPGLCQWRISSVQKGLDLWFHTGQMPLFKHIWRITAQTIKHRSWMETSGTTTQKKLFFLSKLIVSCISYSDRKLTNYCFYCGSVFNVSLSDLRKEVTRMFKPYSPGLSQLMVTRVYTSFCKETVSFSIPSPQDNNWESSK